MYPTIEMFNIHLPLYGLLGLLALSLLVGMGIIVMIRAKLPVFDGLVLGAYGVLGACFGAKVLFMLQHQISFSIDSEEDVLRLMQNGGSAYGGILVGILFCILGAYIHKIDYQLYIRECVFLLPLCHGIWKIGCHCAGCCYGIPYSGIGSIIFLEGSSAPTGQALFPAQMLEAIMLFILAIWIFNRDKRTFNVYLVSYSLIRFFVEFLRNAETKHMIGILSDIQYICLIVILYSYIKFKVKERRHEERI